MATTSIEKKDVPTPLEATTPEEDILTPFESETPAATAARQLWVTTTMERYNALSPTFNLRRADRPRFQSCHPSQAPLWVKTEPAPFVDTPDIQSFRKDISVVSGYYRASFFQAWIDAQLQLYQTHLGSSKDSFAGLQYQWLFLWLEHYEQYLVRFMPFSWDVVQVFVLQHCNRIVQTLKVSLHKLHYPLIHELLAEVKRAFAFEDKLIVHLWSRTLPNSVQPSSMTKERLIAQITRRVTGCISGQLESSLSPFISYTEQSIGRTLNQLIRKETWLLVEGSEMPIFNSAFELGKVYSHSVATTIGLRQPITFVTTMCAIWQRLLGQYVKELTAKLDDFYANLATGCPSLGELTFYCIMINSCTYLSMLAYKLGLSLVEAYPKSPDHGIDLREECVTLFARAIRASHTLVQLVKRYVDCYCQSMIDVDWTDCGHVGVPRPSQYVVDWSVTMTTVVQLLSEHLNDTHFYRRECPTFPYSLDDFKLNCFAVMDHMTIYFEQSIALVEDKCPNANVHAQLKVDWASICVALAMAPILDQTPKFKSVLSGADEQIYQSTLAATSARIVARLDSPPTMPIAASSSPSHPTDII